MALVELKVFYEPEEAWVVASMLRAHGVPVLVQNEQWGMTNYLIRTAIGGFPIWVPEGDEAYARKLLAAPPQTDDHEEEPPLVDEQRVAGGFGKRLAAVLLGLLTS